MKTKILMLPLIALALAGCATTTTVTTQPAPTQELHDAEVAIAKAEQTAPSSSEVRVARQKLATARSAVNDRHMILAERAATQAKADAELATARAEADRARAAASAAERSMPRK